MAKTESARASRSRAHHSPVPIGKVLLVLALPEEQDYLYDVMEARGGWDVGLRLPLNECTFESPSGPVQVIVKVLAGMGPVEAALGTASAISVHGPDIVVMIGLAGALDHDKVSLGDVVVSNSAKLYTVDKVAAPGVGKRSYRFEAEGDNINSRPSNEVWVDPRDRFMAASFMRYLRDIVQCPTADQLLSNVQNYLKACELSEPDRSWIPSAFQALPSMTRKRKVVAGWILGSTHVVDSREYRTYLLDKNVDNSKDIYVQTGVSDRSKWTPGDLLAVDMESYALLRVVNDAMSRPSRLGGCDSLIGGLLVRGISDMCEEKTDLDEVTGKRVRRLAVENATKVGLTLIEKLDYAKFLGP